PTAMTAWSNAAEFDKILQNSYAGQNLTAATPLTEDATVSDASVDWSTHKCSSPQVVNCETNSKGCSGGYTLKALDFERQGVCTEESFPYTSGSSGQAM
ncbi:unnamed protein product, partial [Aphanomyces euteiches]